MQFSVFGRRQLDYGELLQFTDDLTLGQEGLSGQ
jgi:hypothetical protein